MATDHILRGFWARRRALLHREFAKYPIRLRTHDAVFANDKRRDTGNAKPVRTGPVGVDGVFKATFEEDLSGLIGRQTIGVNLCHKLDQQLGVTNVTAVRKVSAIERVVDR